jgi:hypothetical protein
MEVHFFWAVHLAAAEEAVDLAPEDLAALEVEVLEVAVVVEVGKKLNV